MKDPETPADVEWMVRIGSQIQGISINRRNRTWFNVFDGESIPWKGELAEFFDSLFAHPDKWTSVKCSFFDYTDAAEREQRAIDNFKAVFLPAHRPRD